MRWTDRVSWWSLFWRWDMRRCAPASGVSYSLTSFRRSMPPYQSACCLPSNSKGTICFCPCYGKLEQVFNLSWILDGGSLVVLKKANDCMLWCFFLSGGYWAHFTTFLSQLQPGLICWQSDLCRRAELLFITDSIFQLLWREFFWHGQRVKLSCLVVKFWRIGFAFIKYVWPKKGPSLLHCNASDR